MLLRLAYLGITNAFALLRLLPGSDRDKDAEILALRHQLAVLHRQLDGPRVRFEPADRPGWPRCCTNCPDPACTVCGCWCGPTRSCVGTVTCLLAATRRCPGRAGGVGHARSVRSARWYCAWRRRTRPGDTGGDTENHPPPAARCAPPRAG